MNALNSSLYPLYSFYTTTLLLLSACQPTTFVTTPQPTQLPAQPTQSSSRVATGITLDYSSVVQNITLETMAAHPATAGGPYWEAAPQYRILTIQGYPVAGHLRKPQIFTYLVSDLASANENMGKVANDLKTLMQNKQTWVLLPFLPLFSETQSMHAQLQFMDFKNGNGVRFLTQLTQGIAPINNYELIYTFQGLTSDGKYFIAAILPVSNSELPTVSNVSEEQVNGLNDYRTYHSSIITLLNEQPADSYMPDLNNLDEMIRSIEVK